MTNPLKGDAFLAKLAEALNQQNPTAPPITGDDLADEIIDGIDAAVRQEREARDGH